MNTIKKLGDYKQGDTVYFDIKFPFTGNYTLETEVLGVITSSVLAGVNGSEIIITNANNEQVVVNMRVKYPVLNQDDGVNFVTSRIGEVVFQYNSVLSI